MTPRWTVEKIPSGFEVIDANGQSLAYVYSHEDAHMAKVLTEDEARRIASNIAKLTTLLSRVDGHWAVYAQQVFTPLAVAAPEPSALGLIGLGLLGLGAMKRRRDLLPLIFSLFSNDPPAPERRCGAS